MDIGTNMLKEITQAIISQLPIGVSVYDCTGQCVMANKAIADIIGATIDEVRAQNYHEIKSWKKSGLYEAATLAMFEDKSQNFSADITSSFGRSVSLNYYLFPANLFGIRHLVLIAEDITDKNRIISQLSETIKMLDETQQITNIGSISTDLRSGIGKLSKYASTMLGICDASNSMHEDIMSVVHPEDRSYVKSELDKAIITTKQFDFEHRIISNGEIRWVRGRGKVESDEFGVPQRLVGTMEDITDHRILMGELRDAMKKAEAANAAKSEFLAIMTHELRTPLNGIMGYNDLLLGSNLDEKQKIYANRVRDASEGLLTTIEGILDFSSLEAGNVSIATEEFDPRADVVGVLQLIRTMADDKFLALSINVSESVPKTLIGDFRRIRQIITNLVGNAIKFTENGSIMVDIDYEHTSAKNNHSGNLLIGINDTGIGIPEDKIQMLFEKFQQLDASYARRCEGVGLGLAICRKLCDAMGGEICVESKVGVGSTFWFRIPCPPANLVHD